MNKYNLPSTIALPIGSFFLAIMFFESGMSHCLHYESILLESESKGLPFTNILFPISIFIELFCVFFLVIGKWIQLTSFLLASFVISSTIVFFPFWNLTGIEQHIAIQNTVKNLAILGFLIVLYSTYSYKKN